MRKKIRSKYPGACSLEYQSLMNIVVECLFQWDVKEQRSKGKGIFGTTVAFAPADEEQGRKTLHQHVQLWVKEIDSTFRRSLFDENETKRKSTRKKLQAYIDKVMTATYGPDLFAPTSDGSNINPDKLLTDVNLQTLRDARHEELNKDIRGRVMKSKTNGVALSCQELLNHSLNVWKQHAVDDMYQGTSNIYMPPTSERLDIAAYTYSYNMDGGCHKTNDDVWNLKEIRQLLLTHRFDEHEHTHRHSCFKKGCECRFLFPFSTCYETYLHEDRGVNGEHEIHWHSLINDTRKIAPWMIVPKRPMGCQYVNVHNKTLSEVLNCNTNVQVGDPFHMYYITLYNLKSTQEEDSERQRRIGQSIIKRLVRIEDEKRRGLLDESYEDADFTEGLVRMLSGMSAATCRYTISATMGHLLISQSGTRFKFSHKFSDLLVGQLEAALEGNPVDFRLRVNRHKRQRFVWRDSLADDYIHRPTEPAIEKLCSYQLAMKYKKKFLTFKQMKDLEESNISIDDDNEDESDDYFSKANINFSGLGFPFKSSHPGHKFSHLAELSQEVIPKISLPPGRICSIENLEWNRTEGNETVDKFRDDYAKLALLMFYPFRTLADLKLDGSYWKRFSTELSCYKNGKDFTFWEKGFDILQNIQDRVTLEKDLKRARDPVTLQTFCRKSSKKHIGAKPTDGDNKIPDLAEFLEDYE